MTINELIAMLQEEPDKTLDVYLMFVGKYNQNKSRNVGYGEDEDGNKVLIIL